MDRLTSTIDQLSAIAPYRHLFHCHSDGEPMPSAPKLREMIELCRSIIFPGYYGEVATHSSFLRYHIGVSVEQVCRIATDQIQAGLCFLEDETHECDNLSAEEREKTAVEKAEQFVQSLPRLREILATDVEATYNGDPAAKHVGEIISCYPTIRAVFNQRIAHVLLNLGVPLIPRIITELAHSETGIDIHPGAQIGHHFSIDHGTGVVIGETCIIGNNVKLYQGVTLGAKSFPLDADGNPIKGIPRHPIIEDDVIVYSNSTILGRITIGRGSTIGGNLWVTHSVPPGTTLVQRLSEPLASQSD